MAPATLNWLEMLPRIAEFEREAKIISSTEKKIPDLNSLNLLYPNNVVVVTSPTSGAPPPKPHEVRVHKITDAVQTALYRCLSGKMTRCSIVVYGGVYVDGLTRVPPEWMFQYVPPEFTLEIVGVQDVRLVMFSSDFYIVNVNVTLRNVMIYDCRLNLHERSIFCHKSRVEFHDVKIHGAERNALIIQESSYLLLTQCLIYGSYSGCWSTKSEMRMIDTVFDDSSGNALMLRDSTSTAIRCSFLNCKEKAAVYTNSEGTFEECVLESDIVEKGPRGSVRYEKDVSMLRDAHWSRGFDLMDESKVYVKKSTIRGFQAGVLSSGSRCKPTFDDCVVTQCFVAFVFDYNSDGLVENCVIHGRYVSQVTNDVSGAIKFKRNRVKFHGRASFLKDEKSDTLRHDFKHWRQVIKDDKCFRLDPPSRHERSEYTKKSNSSMGSSMLHPQFDPLYGIYHKQCDKCRNHEVPGGVKYKYCKRCERAFYCSKECQLGAWPDHKLACKPVEP